MSSHSANPNGLLDTHTVENQPPILEDYNLYSTDACLKEAVKDFSGDWATDQLTSFGEYLGRAETYQKSRLANTYTPVFHSHDRRGNRYDFVEFHPAYHDIFSESVKHKVHCLPWEKPQLGAHVARAAKLFMDYQIESGHVCPVTMTFGCVPSVQNQPEVWNQWKDKIFSNQYDPSYQPISKKTGAIIGMAMTEKQGGSDIRTNTTTATPVGAAGPGKEYLLTGHKWFCSHPMGDGFLMLAQTSKGPSCFFVPRWRPDETRNNIFVQRLKDKLGDRSNASSEIELKDTWGILMGEEGRGIPIIIEMANYTRVDCAVASAGLMRQALVQALNYSSNRSAFGAVLNQQPIMERLLADLILESEASTRMAMRIAAAYDHQDDNDFEGPFRRIATAIVKYWHTKRAVSFVYECMEVHGGTGYVEENDLARLFRQAPLNSIWEGSGNVMCLDVLRAMQKEPKSVEALQSELSSVAGKNGNYDAHLKKVALMLKTPDQLHSNARQFVELLALALQAVQMLKHATPEMAEAFCANRLPAGPTTFGTLTGDFAMQSWIKRSIVTEK